MCYLEESYGIDHSKVSEKFKKQQYAVGKLFPHQTICAWCLIKLQDAVKILDVEVQAKQAFKDISLSPMDAETWKACNQDYAKVVEDVGLDTLRFELTKQIAELPFDAEIVETGMPSTITSDDGGAGQKPKPKNEIVID